MANPGRRSRTRSALGWHVDGLRPKPCEIEPQKWHYQILILAPRFKTMSKSYIRIQRFLYEEPYHLQLGLDASNGHFRGGFDFYTSTKDLIGLGKQLRDFPESSADEVSWVYGSDVPADRCYRYLAIRAYVTNASGHCAIQFTLNSNSSEPHEGQCKFSILAEAAAINRLGDLLIGFGKLKHLELFWSCTEGELFEDYQSLHNPTAK
jgi:hypothetical protein